MESVTVTRVYMGGIVVTCKDIKNTENIYSSVGDFGASPPPGFPVGDQNLFPFLDFFSSTPYMHFQFTQLVSFINKNRIRFLGDPPIVVHKACLISHGGGVDTDTQAIWKPVQREIIVRFCTFIAVYLT